MHSSKFIAFTQFLHLIMYMSARHQSSFFFFLYIFYSLPLKPLGKKGLLL
jgi:hypothetical protein